jgi:hypothetical protein
VDNARQAALGIIHTFYQTTKAPVTTADLMDCQQVESFLIKHRPPKLFKLPLIRFFFLQKVN